ncbi:hypothetical protein A0J61_10820, partial [Choanephora cucurbitarum]
MEEDEIKEIKEKWQSAKKLLSFEKPDRFVSKQKHLINGFFHTFRLTEVDQTSIEDASLKNAINSEVTDYLIILVKNFVFALALKEKQLTGNNKIAQEQQQQHKLDSLETAIKKFCTSEFSPFAGEGLSDQIQANKVLLWHKLYRTEEKLEYLKEEDERFVRNLSRKLNSVESAVAR